MALYRTYRPSTLAEVVGQPHVTGSLARALDSGRIHHAYLFYGPRGCGKTSTARILARSLNCSAGPTSTPCGTCRSCIELAPNGSGSMDVVELDAATHRGVDDARELRDRAIYAPAASPYKIYIIDEAHQLTSEAANALLKLVEEPPAHLRFVFATTEPDKIIPTIRSRTFNYGFRLVPAPELAEHLAKVCHWEGVPAEPAALDVVARAGAGSVRDSLSVLGQLLAASDSEGLTYASVAAALGVTDAALLDDFVSAISRADPAEMFALVDRVVSAGHDPRRFLSDALDRLRDLMIVKVTPRAVETGLVVAPTDLAATLQAQSQLMSLSELSRAAELVSGGITAVKGATAPRLQLELLCARLALPSADCSTSGILARLAQLERRLSGTEKSDSNTPATPEQPAAPRLPSRTEVSAGTPVPAGPKAVSQPAVPGHGAVNGSGIQGGEPPRRPRIGAEGSDRQTAVRPVAEGTESQSSGPADREGNPRASHITPHARTDSSASKASRESGNAVASTERLNQIRQAWPEILTHLRGLSRVAWMTFDSGSPISLSNGALAVGVADAGRIAFLTRSGHDERLRQSILAVLGLDLTIDVVHHDPKAPQRTPVPEKAHQPTTRPAIAELESAGGNQGPAETAPSMRPAGGALRPDTVADARAPHWDEPSSDDPDASDLTGIELLKRELGGRVIESSDQS